MILKEVQGILEEVQESLRGVEIWGALMRDVGRFKEVSVVFKDHVPL